MTMGNGIFKKAHDFAVAAHGTQKRKFTGKPYIVHLEGTARILWEATNGQAAYEDYAAALLHDVVEDTSVTAEEIGKEFGKEVMELVKELTSDETEKMEEGKKIYITRRINEMTDRAFLIKLCDRLSNVSGLMDEKMPTSFVKWYVKETQYVLDHIERDVYDAQARLIKRMNEVLVCLRKDKGF